MKDPNLSYEEAQKSPCLTCQHSLCCALLPLRKMRVENFLTLDQIGYYLNFEDIHITLSATGEWQVYLNRSCRHLDQENRLCTIHNQSNQPSVCKHYNPYNCHYKKIASVIDQPDDQIMWINASRLELLKSFLRFDDHRKLTAWPESRALFAALSEINYDVNLNWTSAPEDHTEEAGKPLDHQKSAHSTNPCTGCKAYCCQYLVFPVNFPRTYQTFDFYQYSLGFHGVELGVTNEQWTIIVKTHCRHLTSDHQCGIFGQPHRPLTCSYYDAHQCLYKPQFGSHQLQGYLRVKYHHWETVSETFVFDNFGNLIEYPNTDHLRAKLSTPLS